uniref:Uncharacterized protein n=1 Tax=Steinernema glaseri TaxID=37863 RepID=A0A1I7YM03_9BILA
MDGNDMHGRVDGNDTEARESVSAEKSCTPDRSAESLDFSSMPTLRALLFDDDPPPRTLRERTPYKLSHKTGVQKRHKKRSKAKKRAPKDTCQTLKEAEVCKDVDQLMETFSKLMERASTRRDAPKPAESDFQEIQTFVTNEPRDVRSEYCRQGAESSEKAEEHQVNA